MRTRTFVALVIALLVGLAGMPAWAQDDKPPEPKGVTARPLVSSLGTYRASVNAPIAITGGTIELAPGGQTGRQRFTVPTVIHVLEGVLTTDYAAGPVGVKGIQYHTVGQSHVDPGGAWHNYMNTGTTPARFLMIHLGYPGATPLEKFKAED
jgi:quercetin dioxygenase-like cupin family protein